MIKNLEQKRPIDRIKDIKVLYMTGQITMDVALERMIEPVSEINSKMIEIAKGFGKKPILLTPRSAMRIRNFYA